MTGMEVEVGINPAKLATVIRFHLSDLGARNAHHEFEHLSRHLARARVASNILPATGPVSSGGDRGRDFETFETHHLPPGPPGNRFAAHSSGSRRIVFACSLEKKIDAKIRKDVRTQIDAGTVEEVAYFCERNLPIAKRLKLIDEAKSEGLALQIFDGNAIAEWLAEPDIFWIAQEFLHLPAELAPAGVVEESYVARRKRWQNRAPLMISHTDFVSVKAGLRKATFDDAARSDLGFWLERMAAFLEPGAPRDLSRNAMYEIAVANLRGKGNMTSVAGLIDDYFSDVTRHWSIGDITDAVVLLTYSFGGLWSGQFETDETNLFDRRQQLTGFLEECLSQSGIGPGRRAGVLRIRGTLSLIPPAPGSEREFDRAFASWEEMLDCADKAPLFPIEEFCDHLAQMLGYLGERERLLALAERADEVLAKRAGNSVAGDKAIDRAFGLLEHADRIAAIRELHKAKAKWFSGEQLEGMIRILVFLSEQYRTLGLAYAAKYHALAAAYIASYEDPNRVAEMLPGALLDLLDAEDAAGNSLGFLQLFPIMLPIHLKHETDPLEFAAHPRLQENFGQFAALLGFLRRGNPHAHKSVEALLGEWPELIKQPILKAAADPKGFWNDGTWDDAWSKLEGALIDRPFGDLGPKRRVTWEALGIKWICEFANDFSITPHAEQFIAELQLAACAMGGRDLGIVPCSITLKLTAANSADGDKLTFSIPGDRGCTVNVMVPSIDRGPEQIAEVLGAFAAVLHSASALDEKVLMAAFDRSIFEPIFVGRPYAELYREFTPEEFFASDIRASAGSLDPEREFRSTAGERVPWLTGPGPTYDPDEAKLDIAHRYQQTQSALRFTLPRLLADFDVQAHLQAMHDRGMRDWEILSILSNIAINYRLSADDQGSVEEWRERGFKMMNTPESKDEALSPSVFTQEQFGLCTEMYWAAFMNGRQLRAPGCFCADGAERFLIARYRLREDDVDHPDIFGWLGDGAAPSQKPL